MNVYQTDREAMARQTPDERKHRIYYPGTHDSDTLVGWFMEQGKDIDEARKAADEAIESLYASEAGWVIVTLQDMLGLDTSARMNVPGIAEGNWQWKAEKKDLTPELAEKYRELAEKCGR
jgi:4-alpha-glucanotransferase